MSPATETSSALAMAGVDPAAMETLVDRAGFTRWADVNLPQIGDGPLTVRYLTGGATNAVFKVSRGDEAAVLRRPPAVPRPDSEKVLGREARVLAALNGQDVAAPRMLGWCPDHEPIGAAFYMMSFVDGWTPHNDRTNPSPFDRPGPEKRALGFQLIDGVAKLHNVDYRAVGLEGFGKPDGFLERQVSRWLGQLASYQETESYAGRELPGLAYVADWLKANTGETPRVGIIHGDYGFANTLFDHAPPTRLAAMIDWELSTIGDPLLDLGWTVYGFEPRDGVPPPEGLFKTADLPYREELIDYYAGLTGLPVDNIDYYMILAMFKLATLLERKYAESLTGKQTRAYGEFFGQLTLNLLNTAEAMARRSGR